MHPAAAASSPSPSAGTAYGSVMQQADQLLEELGIHEPRARANPGPLATSTELRRSPGAAGAGAAPTPSPPAPITPYSAAATRSTFRTPPHSGSTGTLGLGQQEADSSFLGGWDRWRREAASSREPLEVPSASATASPGLRKEWSALSSSQPTPAPLVPVLRAASPEAHSVRERAAERTVTGFREQAQMWENEAADLQRRLSTCEANQQRETLELRSRLLACEEARRRDKAAHEAELARARQATEAEVARARYMAEDASRQELESTRYEMGEQERQQLLRQREDFTQRLEEEKRRQARSAALEAQKTKLYTEALESRIGELENELYDCRAAQKRVVELEGTLSGLERAAQRAARLEQEFLTCRSEHSAAEMQLEVLGNSRAIALQQREELSQARQGAMQEVMELRQRMHAQEENLQRDQKASDLESALLAERHTAQMLREEATVQALRSELASALREPSVRRGSSRREESGRGLQPRSALESDGGGAAGRMVEGGGQTFHRSSARRHRSHTPDRDRDRASASPAASPASSPRAGVAEGGGGGPVGSGALAARTRTTSPCLRGRSPGRVGRPSDGSGPGQGSGAVEGEEGGRGGGRGGGGGGGGGGQDQGGAGAGTLELPPTSGSGASVGPRHQASQPHSSVAAAAAARSPRSERGSDYGHLNGQGSAAQNSASPGPGPGAGHSSANGGYLGHTGGAPYPQNALALVVASGSPRRKHQGAGRLPAIFEASTGTTSSALQPGSSPQSGRGALLRLDMSLPERGRSRREAGGQGSAQLRSSSVSSEDGGPVVSRSSNRLAALAPSLSINFNDQASIGPSISRRTPGAGGLGGSARLNQEAASHAGTGSMAPTASLRRPGAEEYFIGSREGSVGPSPGPSLTLMAPMGSYRGSRRPSRASIVAGATSDAGTAGPGGQARSGVGGGSGGGIGSAFIEGSDAASIGGDNSAPMSARGSHPQQHQQPQQPQQSGRGHLSRSPSPTSRSLSQAGGGHPAGVGSGAFFTGAGGGSDAASIGGARSAPLSARAAAATATTAASRGEVRPVGTGSRSEATFGSERGLVGGAASVFRGASPERSDAIARACEAWESEFYSEKEELGRAITIAEEWQERSNLLEIQADEEIRALEESRDQLESELQQERAQQAEHVGELLAVQENGQAWQQQSEWLEQHFHNEQAQLEEAEARLIQLHRRTELLEEEIRGQAREEEAELRCWDSECTALRQRSQLLEVKVERLLGERGFAGDMSDELTQEREVLRRAKEASEVWQAKAAEFEQQLEQALEDREHLLEISNELSADRRATTMSAVSTAKAHFVGHASSPPPRRTILSGRMSPTTSVGRAATTGRLSPHTHDVGSGLPSTGAIAAAAFPATIPLASGIASGMSGGSRSASTPTLGSQAGVKGAFGRSQQLSAVSASPIGTLRSEGSVMATGSKKFSPASPLMSRQPSQYQQPSQMMSPSPSNKPSALSALIASGSANLGAMSVADSAHAQAPGPSPAVGSSSVPSLIARSSQRSSSNLNNNNNNAAPSPLSPPPPLSSSALGSFRSRTLAPAASAAGCTSPAATSSYGQ